MSRSSLIFTTSIILLTALSYFLPEPGQESIADSAVLANQVAGRYLQMKETGQFDFSQFEKISDTIEKLNPGDQAVNLTLELVKTLESASPEEGQKNEPKEDGSSRLDGNEQDIAWSLLAYVRGERPDMPDSLAGVRSDIWAHQKVLQMAYDKAGQSQKAAETALDLRFIEQHLRNQARLGALLEMFSLVGMALIIQGLFQYRASKKLKWVMFHLETFDIPLLRIVQFVGSFFFLYVALQFLFSPLGVNIGVMFLAYIAAILVAWFLLRYFWGLSSSELVKKSGLDQASMSLSTGLYAIFGFCVLIFLSYSAVMILQALNWPFQNELTDMQYKNLLSSPWSTSGLVVLSCILAPIAEEFLFRGLVLRSLASHLGKRQALLWTSLIFALFHPISFFPIVFILGLCLGLVFMRSKNLLAPILTHVMWNVFTLIQIQAGF